MSNRPMHWLLQKKGTLETPLPFHWIQKGQNEAFAGFHVAENNTPEEELDAISIKV